MSTDVMTNPKTTTKEKKRISTKVIAQIGVLGAIAMVLMLFDIPLPFAPTFYKIDFSEVPVLIDVYKRQFQGSPFGQLGYFSKTSVI